MCKLKYNKLVEICRKNGIKYHSNLNQKELQKHIQSELAKLLSLHFETTKKERERTHTGKLYQKHNQKEVEKKGVLKW